MNPDEPWPSTETEECDLCPEPWAAEVARRCGPRSLRLCEGCHDRWTAAERAHEAELEEMRGRGQASFAPLFGLVRLVDGRSA